MLHAARFLRLLAVAAGLSACLSYPETVVVEERDASVMPERPAQPIAVAADDAGSSTVEPDAAVEPSHPDGDASPPSPPPDTKPCDECPPGTRCCTKGGNGKGKGKDEDKGPKDVTIVCKPAQADCD